MSIEDPQQLGVNSRRSYIFSSDIVDRAYENLKTAGDLLTVSAKKKKVCGQASRNFAIQVRTTS